MTPKQCVAAASAAAALLVVLSITTATAAAAAAVAGDERPLQQGWMFSDFFHTTEHAKTGAETFFRTTYQRQLLVGRSATGLLPSKQLQSIARTLSQVDAICKAVDRTTGLGDIQDALKVCV